MCVLCKLMLFYVFSFLSKYLLLLGLPDVVLHLQLENYVHFRIPKIIESAIIDEGFTQGDGSGSGPLVFLI